MKRFLSEALPEGIKSRLRPYLDPWKARHLAATSKRLDMCAAQIAHVLHLAGRPTIAGSVCLELGAGWVLSHSLVLHLLGARARLGG